MSKPADSDTSRQRVVLVVVALLVIAVATTAALWANRGRPSAAPTARARVPLPTPATLPARTPTPTPTRSRARPRIPHEFVAAAAPTSFAIAGPKFTIKAHVCGMDNVRPLDPPGEQHHTVCWVQHGFGVPPGSRSATTYILGHAWAQDSLEVLNKASAPATREILHARPVYVSGVATYPAHALDGYVISLRTPSGLLRYTVDSAYGVAKSQAASVAPLMNEAAKQRVVIITCAELNGVDYDYNVIVQARLSASLASRT